MQLAQPVDPMNRRRPWKRGFLKSLNFFMMYVLYMRSLYWGKVQVMIKSLGDPSFNWMYELSYIFMWLLILKVKNQVDLRYIFCVKTI